MNKQSISPSVEKEIKLISLNDFIINPGGFDSRENYLGEDDFPNMYVVVTQTRDSNLVDKCNFECAFRMLCGEGGESDFIKIYQFGHWSCGWFQCLCIHKDSPKFSIALDIKKRIINYPILDEEIYCEMENMKKNDLWNFLLLSERVDMCRESGISIFAARRKTIPMDDDYIIWEKLIIDE